MVLVELTPDYFKKLRKRLKQLGISHGALGREMGVNTEQVSRWLNRGKDPRISSVIAIETAIKKLSK